MSRTLSNITQDIKNKEYLNSRGKRQITVTDAKKTQMLEWWNYLTNTRIYYINALMRNHKHSLNEWKNGKF